MVKEIFVFGSNQAGRHGAGAALYALKNHGAIYGIGEGLQGESYAVPTKDYDIQTLPLESIKVHVDTFLTFAKQHPNLVFKVTQVGCGLAGLRPKDIAPMFLSASSNCLFDVAWKEYLPNHKFWSIE